MIRKATLHDRSAIITITQSIGFEPAEIDTVLASFDGAFHQAAPSTPLWIVYGNNDIHGVAYAEPERMTDRGYNLLLVAVHPNNHKQGIGTKLVQAMESLLSQENCRLLLVETMATPDFTHVRQLYERLGFKLQAQICDYYADGFDKVVYSKKLQQVMGNEAVETHET